MRLPRPKSLSGLMLIGFTIVAAPLLFAIVNAAVQMNRLSIRSQQLVVHGMQGTRNNQRMFEEIEALEREARLYQGHRQRGPAECLCAASRRLVTATHELLTLPLDEASQARRARGGIQGGSIAAGFAACRTELEPHLAESDRQLPAVVGRGIEGVRSDQSADRSGNGEPGTMRRSTLKKISSGRRCCSCP